LSHRHRQNEKALAAFNLFVFPKEEALPLSFFIFKKENITHQKPAFFHRKKPARQRRKEWERIVWKSPVPSCTNKDSPLDIFQKL
jgi:hypothetical protein